MEDVPRRKRRRKLKNRPAWLSAEVLDKCVAAGEARLLEMVEKARREEELEILLSSVNNISVEKSKEISERGRAAILAAYGEDDI
ncbi:hypothetical protein D3C75_615040 [compost metagenome]